MKKLFFILLLSFLLLFLGCSKAIPDCSIQNTDYEKYSYNLELEQCVVSKTIQKDVCGNNIVEEGETSCNCPKDINVNLPIDKGGCSGSKGDFLKYYCEDKTKTCELEVTDKVRTESSLLTLRDGGNFAIDVEVSYPIPFMVDRNVINSKIFLKDKLNSEDRKIRDIVVRKAYVLTQAKELLGSIPVNKKFDTKYEEVKVSVPPNSFTLDTFNKDMTNVFFKLLLSYTVDIYSNGELIRSENKVVELQDIFETKLQLIDPKNKNENLKVDNGWG